MIVPNTPVAPGAIERARTDDPVADVVRAWSHPGPVPLWHAECRDAVRRCMPLLGDALDRLIERGPA